MAEAPAFDPNQPFEPVAAATAPPPAFDPSKPFEPVADVGQGRAALEGFLSGASANFRDEIYGASEASGLPAILGGFRAPVGAGRLAYEALTKPGEATETYRRARDEKRGVIKEAEQQYPWTYGATNVAGAMTAPGGALLRGATLPGRMLRGSAVGATYGAASGAGAGEGAADSAIKGLGGAGVGALTGALAPPLVEGALQGISAATRPLQNAVRGAFAPETEAARQVVTALERDARADPTAVARLTPQEYAAARAEGQPVGLMDLGAGLTRRLADSAGIISPEGSVALNRSINDRFEGQSDRIGGWLQNTFNFPNAQAQQRALDQTAQTINRARYAAAHRDPAAQAMWDEGFEQIMQAPVVQEAAREATRTGANRAAQQGFTPVRRPFEFHDTESLTPRYSQRTDAQGRTILPNLEFWDHVKRGLDDRINKLQRSGENSAARDAQQLRGALVDHLDELVPTYREARAGAAHFFGAENALEAGQTFVTSKLGNDEARQALARMNPLERQLFQDGFVSRLVEQINETGSRRNALNMIAQSPAAQERLNLALGPQRAREFETFLRVEGVMDMARGAVQGNSWTARRLYDLGMAGGAGLGVTGYNFNDPREMALGALVTAISSGGKRVDQNVARRVAEMLISDNPRVLQRGVQLLARNHRFLDNMRTFDNRVAAASALEAQKFLPSMQGALPSHGQEQQEPR